MKASQKKNSFSPNLLIKVELLAFSLPKADKKIT
jgi:hypothetical protein